MMDIKVSLANKKSWTIFGDRLNSLFSHKIESATISCPGCAIEVAMVDGVLEVTSVKGTPKLIGWFTAVNGDGA